MFIYLINFTESSTHLLFSYAISKDKAKRERGREITQSTQSQWNVELLFALLPLLYIFPQCCLYIYCQSYQIPCLTDFQNKTLSNEGNTKQGRSEYVFFSAIDCSPSLSSKDCITTSSGTLFFFPNHTTLSSENLAATPDSQHIFTFSAELPNAWVEQYINFHTTQWKTPEQSVFLCFPRHSDGLTHFKGECQVCTKPSQLCYMQTLRLPLQIDNHGFLL